MLKLAFHVFSLVMFLSILTQIHQHSTKKTINIGNVILPLDCLDGNEFDWTKTSPHHICFVLLYSKTRSTENLGTKFNNLTYSSFEISKYSIFASHNGKKIVKYELDLFKQVINFYKKNQTLFQAQFKIRNTQKKLNSNKSWKPLDLAGTNLLFLLKKVNPFCILSEIARSFEKTVNLFFIKYIIFPFATAFDKCASDFDCIFSQKNLYGRRLNNYKCYENYCGFCQSDSDCYQGFCSFDHLCYFNSSIINVISSCTEISLDYKTTIFSGTTCSICSDSTSMACYFKECDNFSCTKTCFRNIDCPYTAPYCSLNKCLSCQNDFHCQQFGFDECSPESVCIKNCVSSSNCASTYVKPYCINSQCSECPNDEWCQNYTGFKTCGFDTGSCYNCITNNDCKNPGKSVCSIGFCVKCASNSDCNHILSYNKCFFGLCVECLDDNDCGTYKCNQNFCSVSVGCTKMIDCKNPKFSKCSNRGSCEPCSNNNDCLHIGGTLFICLINNEQGNCVECVKNEDCPSALASECVNNKCISCNNNAGCNHIVNRNICIQGVCSCSNNNGCLDPLLPKCSTTNKCIALSCEKNSDCTVKTSGISDFCFNKTCVECKVNEDCPNALFSKCNLNYCSICIIDEDCYHTGFRYNKCIQYYGCKECINNEDCISSYLSKCSNNSCSSCVIDSDCTYLSSNPLLCQNGVCIGCTNKESCISKRASKCENSICVVCNFDEDCFHIPGNKYCLNHGCEECVKNTDCINLSLPKCSKYYKCEKCVTDDDCAHFNKKFTMFCDTNNGSCVGCLNDDQCLMIQLKLPLCIGNMCKECNVNSDCINEPNIYCLENICQNCKYFDSHCEKCTENKCITCQPNYILTTSNKCEPCTNTQYWDEYECYDCISPCLECVGPTSEECLSCIDKTYVLIDQSCRDCSTEIQNCLNCESRNNDIYCIFCKAPYFIYNGACIEDCLGNKFINLNECFDCDPNCNGCIGEGPTSCNECIQPSNPNV